MTTTAICIFCHSRNNRKLYDACDYVTGDVFTLVTCVDCHVVRTEPKVSSVNLGKYYFEYRKKSWKRFWEPIEYILNFWYLRRANAISVLQSAGPILDVGCGRGIELEQLRTLGWKTYGTEYFVSSKIALEKKGISVFVGEVWDAHYPNSFFDVVTMWHSLEHITDPVKLLDEVKRIIKKNGILKIAVPNFDSWEQLFFRERWFHLDVPRHLFHFSSHTLSKILERSGFEITNIQYAAAEYDFYSFCQTVINNIFRQDKNLLYAFLNGRKNIPYWKMILHGICFCVIAPLGIVVVPLSWIFRKSGTIEVTAKKI